MVKALDSAGARKASAAQPRALSLDSAGPLQTLPDIVEIGWASPLYQRLGEASRLADPVGRVLAREQLDGMLAALSTLTAKERAVLTGVLNGKSQQQLADEQGSTRKAVRAALRGAREKLGARKEPLAA